jgi:hypothetical protein
MVGARVLPAAGAARFWRCRSHASPNIHVQQALCGFSEVCRRLAPRVPPLLYILDNSVSAVRLGHTPHPGCRACSGVGPGQVGTNAGGVGKVALKKCSASGSVQRT